MIKMDLSNYSIDGAWPVLLDDFVDFVQRKKEMISWNYYLATNLQQHQS